MILNRKKQMETITDGLRAAKDIGFLEGYNAAITDMLKYSFNDINHTSYTYDSMLKNLSEYYLEKMGEPMPGAKK